MPANLFHTNHRDDYKSRLGLFFRFVLLLTAIGFFERVVFAVYHSHLTSAYRFSEIAFTLLWGIRFDLALSGVLALVALLITYLLKRLFNTPEHKTFKYIAILSGSLVFMLQAADIIYFSDASRHIGYEITDTFNDAPHLLATAWTIYTLPLLFHLALYPVLLLLILRLFNSETFTTAGRRNLHLEAAYLLMLVLAVIMGRGGLQSIPLEPLHAQEISDSTRASLALNGAYNAVFNLFNKDIINPVPIAVPTAVDVKQVFHSLYPAVKQTVPTETWQPNIIFILLESWPAMYMQSYGYDKAVTPFFDKLRQRSLTTRDMLSGGHRTTEGMFSSFCSLQNPLGQTIAQSQLQDYPYLCLPHILRDKGYRTAFFQGSNRNTSGTGAFSQLLGFSESYGKADITERTFKENDWGVYDQDLYAHIYKDLKNSQSPVLLGINTNTTHDIQLPAGVKPAFQLNKSDPRNLNTLHFADNALAEFFNKVENDTSIGDTLWVIVADHTAGLRTSHFNNYRVPFLIYSKKRVKAGMVERVASQRDIAPTVLEILGQAVPGSFSGKSLLHTDNTPYFADYYHLGTLGWIENDLLIDIPVSSPEKMSCYQASSDKLQKNKIPCPATSMQARNRALAFTSTMQTRLFNGKLTKPDNQISEK